MATIGLLQCKYPTCSLCEKWCDGRPTKPLSDEELRTIRGRHYKKSTNKKEN